MSQLPMNSLSPEEQQHLWSQMYVLLGKQVKRYHKHRHMGENTSVPVELALELMESIEYTLSLTGGIYENQNIEDALSVGQNVLDTKVQKAKSMLQLVIGTAPQWQTDCRWEALRCLEQYLAAYDHLHLAHRTPDGLFYPILVTVPDGIRGIDVCLFYLNIMWLENQIMAGVADPHLELFWDRLPPDTLNQCEQLLMNGIGKAIVAPCLDGLVFRENEHIALSSNLKGKTAEELQKELDHAAQRLCEWLNLKDANVIAYAKSIVPFLQSRMEGAIIHGNLEELFL